MEDLPAEDVQPTQKRVVLIGTGHVLQIADAIQGAIHAIRPDAVAVELDRNRLAALRMRRAGNEPPRGGSWVQRRLQKFQQQVAAEYGVEAGDEMLAAVDAGYQVGARVALIDRDVQVTMQRAIKQITWAEKLRMVGTAIAGGWRSLWSRESTKEWVERELGQYQDDPQATLDELAERFPTIRRVLIDERDQVMALATERMMKLDGIATSVVVVGDGHIEGMQTILADTGLELEVFRLQDVRAARLPKRPPDDPNSVSIGFDLDMGSPQPL